MSSFARRLELKILRQKKKIPARHKAPRTRVGMPFRHCKLFYAPDGTISHWTRYH